MGKENIYECEVERRKKVGDSYEFFWKVKPVVEAIADEDSKFRCKDCHGEVKLFRKHVAHAAAPHIEHKYRSDSEYCPAGMYFRDAKDGRLPKLSDRPVK